MVVAALMKDNWKMSDVNLFALTRSYCLLLSFIRPELVVKKLRYYARYIVVCLLLNKMDLVKVLVKVWTEFYFLQQYAEWIQLIFILWLGWNEI